MSDARVIVANACENRDGLIWTRLEAIVPELFAAGPVSIKFCYYAAEDDHRIRPMLRGRAIDALLSQGPAKRGSRARGRKPRRGQS